MIKNWASFAGSWWISDDGDALRYAKFQNIITRETIDIFCIAVADGDIGAAEAFGLMNQMAALTGTCGSRSPPRTSGADRHAALPLLKPFPCPASSLASGRQPEKQTEAVQVHVRSMDNARASMFLLL